MHVCVKGERKKQIECVSEIIGVWWGKIAGEREREIDCVWVCACVRVILGRWWGKIDRKREGRGREGDFGLLDMLHRVSNTSV